MASLALLLAFTRPPVTTKAVDTELPLQEDQSGTSCECQHLGGFLCSCQTKLHCAECGSKRQLNYTAWTRARSAHTNQRTLAGETGSAPCRAKPFLVPREAAHPSASREGWARSPPHQNTGTHPPAAGQWAQSPCSSSGQGGDGS